MLYTGDTKKEVTSLYEMCPNMELLHAKQKIRDNKQMQAQKQIHASQLWQQGVNNVILKSCDIIVLKTLPLVVQCKFFSLMNAQAQIY